MLKDPFDDETAEGDVPFEEKRFNLTKEKKERILKEIRIALTRQPEILFAYAHGSFLEDLSNRDIDIAVYYDNGISKQKQSDLSLTLSAELSHKLRLPVDIHTLNQSSPGFQYYATKGLVVVSRNDEERYDFIENAWRIYLDFEPLLKENLRDLLAR